MMDASTYAQRNDLHIPAPWRAARLQQPSNLRAALAHKDGKVLFGCSLSIPSPHVAKLLAVTGCDWCWIEAEHTPFSRPELSECVQAINFHSEGSMFPVVRFFHGDYASCATALDAGAAAIIAPHVEEVEQVEELVKQCRFPPQGHRSFPPFALVPGLTDQSLSKNGDAFTTANNHVALIPQVESKRGIENLEAIAAVPGIDAIMIGQTDLRLSLGLPAMGTFQEPSFLAAMGKAAEVSKKTGMPLAGLAFTPEDAVAKVAMGFKMLCCTADTFNIVFKTAGDIGMMRQAVAEHGKPGGAAA